jgi:hypothetical protein
VINLVDFFWIWGPSGIWVLALSIFFSAIVSLVNTQRTVSSLNRTTTDLSKELGRITSELRTDTGNLRSSIANLEETLQSGLNEELAMTRQTVDNFHRTFKQVYSWWC